MKKTVKGWIYLFVTIFFFSTIEVATKPFSSVFNPFQITFLRFFFGGLILLIFPFVTGEIKKFKLTAGRFFLLMGVGALNSLIAMAFLQLAVKYSNASTAAILVSSNPVFVVLIAWLVLGEKITAKKNLSLVIGVAGLITIILSKRVGDSVKGIIFGLLSAFSFGFYTVMSKKYIKDIPSTVFAPLSFLFSSIPYYFILKACGISPFVFEVNLQVILMLVYVSFFVTGLAYITFFKALEILDASVSSFSYMLKPVISSIMALAFLGEKPNALKIFGMILVSMSVLVMILKKTKSKI